MLRPEAPRSLRPVGWTIPGLGAMTEVVAHVRRLDAGPASASAPMTGAGLSARSRPEARIAESQAVHRILREVAEAYAGPAFATIPILRDSGGKPHFKSGGLEFSLSHKEGWCAIALSKDGPVGIDLEPIRPFPEMETVALHFFPPPALAEFEGAGADAAAAVFFKWWTRLEAAVKAAHGGVDKGAYLFNAVTHQSWSGLDGFALGLAAWGRRPLAVEWNLQVDQTDTDPEPSPSYPRLRNRAAMGIVFPRP